MVFQFQWYIYVLKIFSKIKWKQCCYTFICWKIFLMQLNLRNNLLCTGSWMSRSFNTFIELCSIHAYSYAISSILNHNHLSTLRLSHHDRLSWSCRHHRLSRGSILGLAHLLRGVHGLLLVEHGLLLRHALSDIGSINLLWHINKVNTIIIIEEFY